MYVVSVKLRKKQMLALLALAVLIIAAVVFAFVGPRDTVSAAAEYDLNAATDAERKAFLAQYGWETAEDPVEICEVIIPEEFNEVYTQYNALQQEQGFDLSRFKGRRVKRWTYEITNYPDETGKLRVYADLLIYDGKVIGGNVGTREMNGFLQGFRRNSAPMQSGTSSLNESMPSSAAVSDGATSSLAESTASGLQSSDMSSMVSSNE